MDERLETGSYILRSLIKNIALVADGQDEEVHITCVELWEENLYIGTSAGEVLHHVRFPPDPKNPTDEPSFILASRQTPPVIQPGDIGIQQILLLPAVGKACILSNNTLSFYSLPELSPSVPSRPISCGWVGGVDLDADPKDGQDGVVIMLCHRNRIRLAKVGDTATRVRDIEFAACLSTVRRGDFACVADARSYALLDVVHQQKIPLFTVSSLDDQSPQDAGNLRDDLSTGSGSLSRALSPIGDPVRNTIQEERGHRKSSSLNIFRKDSDSVGQDLLRPGSAQRYGFDSPIARRSGSRRVSTTDIFPNAPATPELGKPLPPPPPSSTEPRPGSVSPAKPIIPLKPLIASPNSHLFLLITGTAPDEPSLGMFVNLDGDIDRGTIGFPNYPEAVVVDGKGQDMTESLAAEEFAEEGYVLAVVRRSGQNGNRRDVEIQRWDVDASEGIRTKEWLNVASLDTESKDLRIGLRSMTTNDEIVMPEILSKLAMKPSNLLAASRIVLTENSKREKEEKDLIQRLCKVGANLTLWRGNEVFWLVRNPTVLKLDSRLRLAQATSIEPGAPISPQRHLIESLFNEIRDSRTTNELDYYSLGYIRQKAALLLFMELVLRTLHGDTVSEVEKGYTEQALIESEVDPRILLTFLPTIRSEILQAEDGIWLSGGLRDLINSFLGQYDLTAMSVDLNGPYGHNLVQVLRRFLTYWRQKKGHPSVIDGTHVFPTVDAALLHILLQLDHGQPPGIAVPKTIRAELYAVVDNGLDGFDRAVELLEQFKRLYVLSRLYQKRKSLSMVLSTWKRILSGEEDLGGEFTDGELELRRYLSKLKDRNLVIEYATWLANRNPKLGVQVFADENSRVTIPTSEALKILREHAPNAVKDYLEYLVFGKKQSQHINELIAYYLDIVLDELQNSKSTRAVLLETYQDYRALQPPKPTYRQFITDNAIEAEWWHSRLRLLHLLGSNHGPASSYDILKILTRLEPYVSQLVPEMIILNGRQGRHKEALRLLTHGLGDFDTAISYCLLGGSSIYRPPSGYVPEDSLATRDDQAALFNYLLLEFLAIENEDSRIERTGELLERFGPWFDPAHVLSLLPDSWAVTIFSTFLVNSLQKLVRDRRETVVTKALSMAQNLRVSDDFVEKAREVGPFVQK